MDSAAPAWVKKRDGRVVAFDPDVISQDLFNATEALGQPDAFLARELTEGVLHFLAADSGDSMPTTQAIAELIVKVVRELRQPQLAQAFASRPRLAAGAVPPHPDRIAREAVQRLALETVFTRDVAAAHRDGLLQLTGLAAPLQMAAAVLPPARDPAQAIADARRGIAGWLVLDGPEYDPEGREADVLVRALAPVVQATGLTARLQLNCAKPPPWALATAHGPLFAEPAPLPECLAKAEALFDAVLALDSCNFVVDWHLGVRDFDPPQRGVLGKLAQVALQGRRLVFSFDRPRRDVFLGPGLDRSHPALLMTVALQLPRLLEYAGPAVDIDVYLAKLASLARLAVSAGVQKRQYLRGAEADPFLERGLLRERARLLIRPVGLDVAVCKLTAAGLCDSKEALDTGRRILLQLSETLVAEGRRRLVDCLIDVPEGLGESQEIAEFVLAPSRQQLRVWERLRGVTGTGGAVVGLEEGTSTEEVVELLEFAWRQTELAWLRFRLRHRPPVVRQLTLP